MTKGFATPIFQKIKTRHAVDAGVKKKRKKKESDYTSAKFYYQMPFISSSELGLRI